MMKNIPNKYTRAMILELLNRHEELQHTFDFFYLPIDFRNRCNLGYAFINFTSALAVIDFYEKFHEHVWENSTKTCQVSFGRLQGMEALINQFKKRASEAQIPEKYMPLCFLDGQLVSLSMYGMESLN